MLSLPRVGGAWELLALPANWGWVSFFGLSGSCRVPALGFETFFGGEGELFFDIFWVRGCIYHVGTAFQRGECKVRFRFRLRFSVFL